MADGVSKCLKGFTRDGREVQAVLSEQQVCLNAAFNVEVWVSHCDDKCLPFVELRKTLAVECTGLGGSELGSPVLWDPLIRTGQHPEEVYGPSLNNFFLIAKPSEHGSIVGHLKLYH